MNLHWLITNALAAMILPPMGLIWLAGLGWLLWSRWWYLGRSLIALAVLLLVALSTETGAKWLAAPLEREASPGNDAEIRKADAIVILGGGRMHSTPGQGSADAIGPTTLMRVRLGAQLHRQTRLPVLVSGGAPDGQGISEAELMARSLKDDFNVGIRWKETQSINTAENALYTSGILLPRDMRRIVLVTDAIHMARARRAFERVGFNVITAPSGFVASGPLNPASFIPTAHALRISHYALHEWLGLLWYRVSWGVAL